MMHDPCIVLRRQQLCWLAKAVLVDFGYLVLNSACNLAHVHVQSWHWARLPKSTPKGQTKLEAQAKLERQCSICRGSKHGSMVSCSYVSGHGKVRCQESGLRCCVDVPNG